MHPLIMSDPFIRHRPSPPAPLTLRIMRRLLLACLATLFSTSCAFGAQPSLDKTPGLVGYWRLRGDCRDYSGHGNHGVNHGVNLDSGTFDGISPYIEVPGGRSLKLGVGDFSLSVWIHTEKDLDDVVGD